MDDDAVDDNGNDEPGSGEPDHMPRLEAIVARLPEAIRVDVEAWEGEPTFRVRKKNFVFTNRTATGLSVKLPNERRTTGRLQARLGEMSQ